MTNKSVKQDDPKQSKRFVEAAREHGAAETKESADRAFKQAAKPKLKPKR
jgi:hypothetical protein